MNHKKELLWGLRVEGRAPGLGMCFVLVALRTLGFWALGFRV